jgi:hypothetical protein
MEDFDSSETNNEPPKKTIDDFIEECNPGWPTPCNDPSGEDS